MKENMDYMHELDSIQKEVNGVIQGKEDIVKNVLAAVICGGHILMEDIPGVGKTTLAMTFARALSLNYKRVQFTPDVLPGDITGFSMPDNKSGEFVFHEGAVFCNLFLADEINRTSPKTQSALLEVMEERSVTVDGVTHHLPRPFVVIATQNPVGASGTQKLPESQLDRFMVRLSMGYPSHTDEVNILKGEVYNKVSQVKSVLTKASLIKISEQADKVFVRDELYEYIVGIVGYTRQSNLFSLGASPRAAIALLKISRANAVLNGRDFVTPQDIQEMLVPVLGHRVVISPAARAQDMDERKAVEYVSSQVKAPRS